MRSSQRAAAKENSEHVQWLWGQGGEDVARRQNSGEELNNDGTLEAGYKCWLVALSPVLHQTGV